MKIIRAATLILLMILTSSTTFAFNLSGQSRTYLRALKTTDSTRLLPFYEYLDLRADDIGMQASSFHASGWFRYDLQNESYGEKSTSDLQYAYLSMKGSQGNAFLNLGRMFVNQGVASSLFDGVSAGTDLRWGFGISAFTGIPVETDSNNRSGDSVYGGRVSHGKDGLYRVGVSYLHERDKNSDYRKEGGLDLWFRPINKVELLGTSQYNAITSHFASNTAYLTLGPFQALTIRAEYTDISYKDFFTTSTLSALQLRPGGSLDPKENLKTGGGSASLTFGPVSVSADYKSYQYDLAGTASYFGGRVTYTGAQKMGAGLSIHRMDGETNALRYNEYRIYGYKKFDKVDISADILTLHYDTEMNGVTNAYSASLSGGYSLTGKIKLGVDVEYSKNPYYDNDVRGLVKLVYNFDVQPAIKGRK